jgi:hypothetical protein
MVEMQQATSAPLTPAAPAAPSVAQTAPPPASAPVFPSQPAPTTGTNLSQYSVSQLRGILQRLKSERGELASRRSNTEGTYENATGASQEGLGKRLNELDANIISYEREIARVGQEYALRGGGPVAEIQPGGSIPPGYMPEDDAAGMAFGFSFATLLLTFFVTRRFLRRKYAGLPHAKQQPNMIASNERLERIEQAVDTIAVEVERVSENQRFMTRLMTETQLGDTIKDVRKSAELAKSAAADSSG